MVCISVYKLSCAEKVCYDHAYPIGHFKYLKYNGFLNFVLRKLNETNTSFLYLVVRDGDYPLEEAVPSIINLSLQLELLPIE